MAFIAVSSLCAVLFFWSSQRTSARDEADSSEVAPTDVAAHSPERDIARSHFPSLYDPALMFPKLPLPQFEEIDLSRDLDFGLFSPRHDESTSLLAQLDLQDQLFGLGQHMPFPYAGDAQYFRAPHAGSGGHGGFGGSTSGFAGGGAMGGGIPSSQGQSDQSPPNSGIVQNAIVTNPNEQGGSNTGNGSDESGSPVAHTTGQSGPAGPTDSDGPTNQSGSNDGDRSNNNNDAPVKVPEPSALVLTSLGVATVAAMRRRRPRSIE